MRKRHTSIRSLKFSLNAVLLLILAFASVEVQADQTVTVRSGNGTVGSRDSLIRVLQAAPSSANFIAAQTAPFAFVAAPHPFYIKRLPSDPSAQWVALTADLAPGSALYAFPFQLTDATIVSATLDIRFSVDNLIDGVFINGTRISGNSTDGDYHAEYRFVRNDIAPLLQPNSTNWLYMYLVDDGGFAGLMFNTTITTTGGGIQGISPDHGGNAGLVTVQIKGPNLSTSATAAGNVFNSDPISVDLTAVGLADIVGVNPKRLASDEIVTTFDLRGQPPGPRDVTVTLDDSSVVVIPGAFEVLAGGGGEITLDLLGPAVARVNRDVTFVAYARNIGLNDIGVLSYEFGPEDAAPSSLASVAASAGTIGGISPDSFASTSAVFRFLSCSNIIFRVLDRRDPDNCEPIRKKIRALTVAIGRVSHDLDDAIRKYGFFKCDTPPPAGGLGTITCLDLLAQIEQLKDELATLTAQLAVEQEKLRECEARSSSGNSTSSITRVQILANSDTDTVQTTICPVFSWDPNDKVGLSGNGEARYVTSDLTIPYTVFFENKAVATAPAQSVIITDRLDPSFDLGTFALGPIRFGDRVIEVPEKVRDFTSLEDLRPAMNLLVRVTVHLDTSTRVVTWQFTSLDPDTQQPPTDPLAGFLPPNIIPPQGEGSVSYTVALMHGTTTNTVVHNQANITFDSNPVISTPVWSNTVDNDKPTSHVLGLNQEQLSASFLVQWSGTDVDSGIQDFTIFVSDNEGPFVVWLQNTRATSATFVGLPGHKYGFYSIARDLVHNVEALKTVPDAVTTVVADTLPPVITVSANPATLWPPNGKMVPVTVSGTITDPESGVNASTATYAVTDEYGSVQPSGHITLGPTGSYSFTIQLQAARNGNDKDGRQYTITIRAQDNARNRGSAATGVTVPHDQGK
jgi:hypothetical protein